MNYKYHMYCAKCMTIYRRKEFAKYKNPKCPFCGKMLRKGPRRKTNVPRMDLSEYLNEG
jgi:PHP family Zn ribbon phosphoesterase